MCERARVSSKMPEAKKENEAPPISNTDLTVS